MSASRRGLPPRGSASKGGVCIWGVCIQGGLHLGPPQILWDRVNERAVRILLECFLVSAV